MSFAADEIELVMPLIDEPIADTRTAVAIGDAEGDWLCAWCLSRVANERDRFKYRGKDHFTFANPAGIRFEILTFSTTVGCHPNGVRTLEHTWFAGHAWSYCQCDNCGQHLGWFYSGEHEFAGLIIDRLVRAHLVRN